MKLLERSFTLWRAKLKFRLCLRGSDRIYIGKDKRAQICIEIAPVSYATKIWKRPFHCNSMISFNTTTSSFAVEHGGPDPLQYTILTMFTWWPIVLTHECWELRDGRPCGRLNVIITYQATLVSYVLRKWISLNLPQPARLTLVSFNRDPLASWNTQVVFK